MRLNFSLGQSIKVKLWEKCSLKYLDFKLWKDMYFKILKTT